MTTCGDLGFLRQEFVVGVHLFQVILELLHLDSRGCVCCSLWRSVVLRRELFAL